MHHTKQISS